MCFPTWITNNDPKLNFLLGIKQSDVCVVFFSLASGVWGAQRGFSLTSRFEIELGEQEDQSVSLGTLMSLSTWGISMLPSSNRYGVKSWAFWDIFLTARAISIASFQIAEPPESSGLFSQFQKYCSFFIFSGRVINLLTALKRKNVVLGRLSFCLLSLPPTNWLANEQIFFLCSSISQLFDLQVGRGETAGWQTAKRNKYFAGDAMAALAAPSFCAFPLLLHPIGLVVFIIKTFKASGKGWGEGTWCD